MVVNEDKNAQNNQEYYSMGDKSEVKINMNFQHNNIFTNVFSNVSLFEKRSTEFELNGRTLRVDYVGHINEEAFSISYFEKKNGQFVPISPWHDLELINKDGTYNMIVEIPKYNYIKMEVNLKQQYNILKQDMKKGKLRFYHNSIYWNYGALPQTYEYPKHVYKCKSIHKEYLFTGDNDPLDIVDIGEQPLKMGQIVPVKVLGAFTLVDEGELDWKIIAINKYDEHFAEINSLDDIEKYYPFTLSMLVEWFRSYKMADSKKLNLIGKELINRNDSEQLIKKTNEFYKEFLKDVEQLRLKGNNTEMQVNGNESIKISDKLDHADYKDLLKQIQITYYKPNPNFQPDLKLWVP